MSQTSSSSTDPPAPQSSALPPSHPFNTDNSHNTTTTQAEQTSNLPILSHKVVPDRKPLLRLELRDLSSDGSFAFLRLVHASHALSHAVDTVLMHLYTGVSPSHIPGTRSVTLILREMDGVAYTTGLALDDDHKEIHFNTKYISFTPESRQKEEILGVLVHEMVHCWQHSGFGSAPVGLTEGVADWVRLKAGLAPPHWKRDSDCEWDAGYQHTGYFLEWLEKEHGEDVVRRINQALRGCKYDGDSLWQSCCGKSVEGLWAEYKKSMKEAQ
ncbi:BSP-domain-containing protein [Clathrospora elynae]|uniref:BSP-domain-containing protein n=1 Tax=Clathrospora elynae TaxID=706981 RepID=A0A6A5SRB3_9PLEO|nr:BSP-domain-containing protein [Clathrospora elynae]